MKKMLFIFLLVAAVAITAGLINKNQDSQIIDQAVVKREPPKEQSESSEKKNKPSLVLSEKESDQEQDINPYAGQPLEYLGDPEVLAKYDKAIVDKQRVELDRRIALIKEDGKNMEAWNMIAIIKKFFDNYIGARDVWEYAKKLDPTNPKIYLNLGNLYGYYLNDIEKAEQHLFAAVNINPIFVQYALALANFYRDFDMKDKAVEVYTHALSLDPDNEAIKAEIERLQESS